MSSLFLLEASVPSDYMFAVPIFRKVCPEGSKWLIPGALAPWAPLIWDRAPSYLIVDATITPAKLPSDAVLATTYPDHKVVRASVLPKRIQGQGFDQSPDQLFLPGQQQQGYGYKDNKTPLHTVQYIGFSVGLSGRMIYPDHWTVPRPERFQVLVHVGREVSVPGLVNPVDLLTKVKWPAGTATVGTLNDRLVTGTIDARSDRPMDLRVAIRKGMVFVGVPGLLTYHAAACGLRTLCVFPKDRTLALWQSRGVNVWFQDDMIPNEAADVDAWLNGARGMVLTPGPDSFQATPNRRHLYPEAGRGAQKHRGQGFSV